jgi:type VI secretion system secreted protein Hcp
MPYGIYLHSKFKGGSAAKGHEDAIEILSVNHSQVLPVQVSQSREGGLSAGDPVHSPITVTYELSGASPKVDEALNTGEHVDKMEIHFDKPGGDALNFHKITLEDVVISRHDLSANSKGNDMVPLYTMDLTYNKITNETKTMDNKGKAKGTVAATYSPGTKAKG